MIYPSIADLTKNKFNRYELVIGTAKSARLVTDEYVKEREAAEKMIANRETEKPLSSLISPEYRDQKAVKIAIGRMHDGKLKMVRKSEEEASEGAEAVAEAVVAEETALDDAGLLGTLGDGAKHLHHLCQAVGAHGQLAALGVMLVVLPEVEGTNQTAIQHVSGADDALELGHFLGNLFAYCSVFFQGFFFHSHKLCFCFIGIGYKTILQYRRYPRNIGKSCRNHSSGTRFNGTDSQVFFY